MCCARSLRHGVVARRCHGRRRRGEFLGPRFLWKPRGGSPAAGMVAGDDLLSQLRVGRRRRRVFPRIYNQQDPSESDGKSECKRKPERERHRRSWLCDPELRVRNACARRPGGDCAGGSLWPRRLLARGHPGRHVYGAVRQYCPVRAIRQHQRGCGDLRIWCRNSRCAGMRASTTS